MEINKSIVEANQESIRKRIDNYIEYDALISPTEFATKVGLDPSGLIKMLKGQMKITLNTIKKISDATGIKLEWLAVGKGDMYEVNEPTPEISYTNGVPYYNEDFLLGFEEITQPSSENPDFLIRMPGYEKATLWCNASGHSMEPEINNGDIIALQRIDDFLFLPYGDVYGFITTNGLRTIKRLGRSEKDGYYKLIPTNKDYDDQEIPINKIALVYRVMGAMKAF
ncbi:LexA family transcriptional regulator [bacterium]|nr:LexA family transcriptional regulator [bacterium]